MNPLSKLIREICPSIYVTPISVMQSLSQLAIADHVPLDNPPFETNP